MKFFLSIFSVMFFSACTYTLPNAHSWTLLNHSHTIRALSWNLATALKKSKLKRNWTSLISPHEGDYIPACVFYKGNIKIGNNLCVNASFSGYPVASYAYNSQLYLIGLYVSYDPQLGFIANPYIRTIIKGKMVDINYLKVGSNLWINCLESLSKVRFKENVANSLIFNLWCRQIQNSIFDRINKGDYVAAEFELVQYISKIETQIEQSPHIFYISRKDFEKQIIEIPADTAFSPQIEYISDIFYKNKTPLYNNELDNYWWELLQKSPKSRVLFVRLDNSVKNLITYARQHQTYNDKEYIEPFRQLRNRFKKLLSRKQ